MKNKYLKFFLKISILICIVSTTTIWFANYNINKHTKNSVYNNIQTIPTNKVGLLLGTCKYLRSGIPNQYFFNRILATEQLYKSGKISFIVISGDNSRKNYNEPQDMKDELIRRGIPAEKIYLDYAGFRTFDSVYRLNAIFGQRSFTVISQEFHNRRAIYIAKSLHLNAVGFNANDVDAYNGFKTKLREKFACVKALLDIAFRQRPKFLGERISIE